MSGSSNSSLETRTFLDEVRGLEKNWMVDLGHPLLNRVAESFVKAAGVRPPSHSPFCLPFCFSRFLQFTSPLHRRDATVFNFACFDLPRRSAQSRRSRGSLTSWPWKARN